MEDISIKIEVCFNVKKEFNTKQPAVRFYHKDLW